MTQTEHNVSVEQMPKERSATADQTKPAEGARHAMQVMRTSQTASAARGARQRIQSRSRFLSWEFVFTAAAVVSAAFLLWQLMNQARSILWLVIAGIAFTVFVVLVFRTKNDPDSIGARQSSAMLELAQQSLAYMGEGMTQQAAQNICELLLPATAAIAVAITDEVDVLGYAGFTEEDAPAGKPIRTTATYQTIEDGEMRVLLTSEDIGFPTAGNKPTIRAAIIVPLLVGGEVTGTLKFYFRSPRHISETQKSIAEGFGQLLSTQMAAARMEEQTKLASQMKLKALQSQINPHFLFNTINTIASLIRTDPVKARTLLRDFAVFYRRTLEDSADLILFSRELEQTLRYFSFEVARFGEDRLQVIVGVDEDVKDMLIPPFMIQPLVENAVHHAMPSEGMLSIKITAETSGSHIVIKIADDGVGMTQETCESIMHPKQTEGIGIAVKNVNDRIRGFFGGDSAMVVESELGVGTVVTLYLDRDYIQEPL